MDYAVKGNVQSYSSLDVANSERYGAKKHGIGPAWIGDVEYWCNGRFFSYTKNNNTMEKRKESGVLLNDFKTTDKLTLTAGSTGATITPVTDVNGNSAVRFTSGTAISKLDIEIPIQNFSGKNADGSDFDGLGLMFYMPSSASMTSIELFVTSDTAYPAGSYKNEVVNRHDGPQEITTPPSGGWNWFYLRKQDFTSGSLDFSDTSKLFVMVRITLGANTGYLDLSSLWWNLTNPINQAVITFDDAYKTIMTEAFPYMRDKGIKGTVYVSTSLIGTGSFLSWDDLHVLDDAGWDICNHTNTHLDALGLDTPSEVRSWLTDVALADKALADNNLHRGRKHFAYPGGSCTPGIHDVAIKEAGFITARTINTTKITHHIIGNPTQHQIPARGVISTDTSQDLINRLDTADFNGQIGAGGRTCFFYLHSINNQDGNIFFKPSEFKIFIDDLYSRLQAGTFESKTITEWSDYAGL